ncbi:STAS domain-containing protein [filamentous cyanobacterium LEGE 11480]|uniref:Anti-sigma factor antagonist n=1 Tax=Romeriopsis navalis LEGE 11480 TaxID=2777977 RepID=A0A928VPL5_9CYAN|nr:STAS domain-containing protein [Romeriopsis navalis]MBE9029804.1 STAS domain-containing protein [Romeriopsis navalis LEGE 11480]
MLTQSTEVKFLRLSGTFDSRRSQEIQQQLDQLQVKAGDMVVMNLQDVDHMNSSGIGVLVLLLKQLQAMQVRFYLCYPSAAVMLALRMSGMLRNFAIYGHDRPQRLRGRLPGLSQTRRSDIGSPV